MTRRRLFSTLAAMVALLATSPITGRAVTPPKWVVSRWFLDWENHRRTMGVGVEVMSGTEIRRHAVGYEINAKSNLESLHASAKRRLTEWVGNLNTSES